MAKYPEIVQAVLDGKHDDDLDLLSRAVAHRIKTTVSKAFRKEQRVRFANHRANGETAGKEAVVLKVNAKTISVVVPCATCGRTKAMTEAEYDAAYDAVAEALPDVQGGVSGAKVSLVPFPDQVPGICSDCHGEPQQWRVSPSLLEAVASCGEGTRA